MEPTDAVPWPLGPRGLPLPNLYQGPHSYNNLELCLLLWPSPRQLPLAERLITTAITEGRPLIIAHGRRRDMIVPLCRPDKQKISSLCWRFRFDARLLTGIN